LFQLAPGVKPLTIAVEVAIGKGVSFCYGIGRPPSSIAMDLLLLTPVFLLAFALGASIGSFINVVVYRLPAELSLLWPPSRCPHCLHRLAPVDNIPVFGWLRLKGRCAYCGTAIAKRYPLVEAATGLLFVGVVVVASANPVQMVGYWVFFSWLLALSLIDFDTMTLPNPLTQSGLILGLAFQGILGTIAGSGGEAIAQRLSFGIFGAVLGMWLLEAIAFVGSIAFGKTAMGAGDAKLAAMMGAWLGWKSLLVACFLACAIGAFGGGAAIALGALSRHKPMPFGPFLALGAVIAAIWGEAIVTTYLDLFFAPLR
jgi:leader peptidase (prepilin peptidase)/N-methyltransferase